MSIRVSSIDLHVLNMRTRMPFRYGIATLTAVPHLFVCAHLEIDGQRQSGIAADHLPPKWFTKDPESPYSADLDEMIAVIQAACRFAQEAGPNETLFDWWQAVYHAQERWATPQELPPLLWGFGVSLVERAAIDAFCRAKKMTFFDAVQTNALGMRLDAIFPELADTPEPSAWLPSQPRHALDIRHTVGLGDPLYDAEIAEADRVTDPLPQSLAASIQAYGLRYFKIKISGQPEADRARLQAIAALFQELGVHQHGFTLDGNEQYRSLDAFRQLWQSLHEDADLAPFLQQLLFVEQPFHRDIALSESLGQDLRDWQTRPPIIIDESGGALDSLPRALDNGYHGVSHKNCKGVFKGIANACLLAKRKSADPQGSYILSGEDLSNVGPVALQQDLAALATLGVSHAERNGHHYFAGLSALSSEQQSVMLDAHPDLYEMCDDQFATLAIRSGQIELGSVIRAPFGVAPALDLDEFTPLEQWHFDSPD